MPYWRLFYHFVWGTKGREPLIRAEVEAAIYKAILAKAKDLGALAYAVGGTEDHVHLVVSAPPRLALADFVGQVKGSSSHLANHALSLAGAFAWQGDYGVVSFGAKQLDRVVKYVRAQRQHHAEGTTIRFLEAMETEDTARPIGGVS